MSASKRILIAPLDWGLGHATRCMPLIDYLTVHHHEVTLAGSGASLLLLKKAYPQLDVIELPPYDIRYPEGANASFQVLLQTPKVWNAINNERRLIAEKYTVYKWDYIISDNRYGVQHPQAKNIFMCHQVAIRAPKLFSWTNSLFLKLHLHFIKDFNELWIPDVKGKHNISGKLAHNIQYPIPHHYIGVLSRFINKNKHSSYVDDIDFSILAVLSGPEPQRTSMEKKLLALFKNQDKKVLLVQGITDTNAMRTEENVHICAHLHADDLLAAYHKADLVICRSGYSTLMDLSILNKKAVFIPTHGQTEQEYLAHVMEQRKMGVVWNPYKQAFSEIVKEFYALKEVKIHPEYKTSFWDFISNYKF